MKKILAVTAIILCASFIHAAQLNWSSGSYSLVDKDGNLLSSYAQGGEIVLALLGSDYDKFSDATILGDAGTVNYSAGKGGGSTKVSGEYSFTYSDTSIQNGNVLAVLYKNSDGSLAKLLTASGESAMFNPYTVSGMSADASQANTWFANYDFATSNFQEPIPEPTSGLLLLVGGALLALRRKQK